MLAAAKGKETDAYRELEDSSQPRAQAFYREQGERAREALAALPGRAALLARIRALSDSTVSVTSLQATRGARVFYLKRAPGHANRAGTRRVGKWDIVSRAG